jgi:hypothetical protein
MFIIPVCSFLSVSVVSVLKAKKGIPTVPEPNTSSTSFEPSDMTPVRPRSFSATLLVASSTAWK